MEKPKELESAESNHYELNVVVHRHGPKSSISGPLSDEGQGQTRDFFDEAYRGIVMEKTDGIEIEHSPIHRAKETARIYAESIDRSGSGKIQSINEDERLSEGRIAENEEVISNLHKVYGKGAKWLKGWLSMKSRPSQEVKTGGEAVADFCSWLFDKLKKAKDNPGKQEVDAFSHGPLMLAFLVRVEELTGEKILPDDWEEIDIYSQTLNYLTSFIINIDYKDPDNINLIFNGKKHSIPISVIQEMMVE